MVPTGAVTADARSLIINGKRKLLISGEIHYARVPRAEWERVLDRTKEAGVNCIASYIFWNVHEPTPDTYRFADEADLGAFLDLCRERELDCILRIGPYCCAEWNYGGFPVWLRDIPGITLRTWNAPYIARIEKYFRILIAGILPHLVSRGGNVILVQVENEYNNVAKRYGAEGQRYLAWIVDYVKSLGIDVPTITCEGGAPGAIEAVNGFSVHEAAKKLRQHRPELPLIWSENWPGWYDTWGCEHHVRQPFEIGYEILRFIAVGGSGFNYYMWHGGTNFGRTSMYLQTTRYDFDCPLGEWGEATGKYHILQALHRALLANQEALLSGQRHEAVQGEEDGCFTVLCGAPEQAVLLSFNVTATPHVIGIEKNGSLIHPPKSACLWEQKNGGWKPVWKSWKEEKGKSRVRRPPRWWPVAGSIPWLSLPDPRLEGRQDGVKSVDPIEQICLTKDRSDYCWYAVEIKAAKNGSATLRINRGGDFFYVFVNGRLAARTHGPLHEVRGPTVSGKQVAIIAANALETNVIRSGKNGYEHIFSIPLRRGPNRIEILACSLGLIKGDWQLALPMQYERKGIWDSVFLDGKRLLNWSHYPALTGEHLCFWNTDAYSRFSHGWKARKKAVPLSWHLKQFSLSSRELHPETVWAFDASGLEKGVLWINGRMPGRFWQIPAHGIGDDPVSPVITTTGAGEPTQRFYRIPASWLRPENRLVIFSESGAAPCPGALVSRRYKAC